VEVGERYGGSIPARAGKPSIQCPGVSLNKVDPRASGEARSPDPPSDASPGRSPRERGSPFATQHDRAHVRSIPARAGKPPLPPARTGSSRVDPRASGEAVSTRGRGLRG